MPCSFRPTVLAPLGVVALGWWMLASCGAVAADEPAIDFNAHVRPIFVKHCLACHGGVKQAGGLSFVTREQAMALGDSGESVIVPGDAAASILIDRVSEPDDDYRMPPAEHGERLDEADVAILRQWIDRGAAFEIPWAFRPPQRGTPPDDATGGPHGRIDAFVRARLNQEQIEPAAEADRAQWLRRVSFDLVGLPPTEHDRIVFETDHAPGAYERVVDRLLSSPHFGERWASVWLDLARYADTMGYERDMPRDVWPWRDWVVGAFNADMPYDEFLLKQTAGDLLPDATLDDRLATTFHRNSQTNVEGGTDDEEFRWSAVVDRVDSTWQGLLGMTMACARCHDHPYDPLWQTDYYRFAALLNTTRDADLAEDWPKLRVPKDPARREEAAALHDELSEVRRQIHAIGVEAAEPAAPWRPLSIDEAKSTGETRLEVRTGEAGPEVVAVGTVTDRSFYTLRSPAPVGAMTALRIDVSPLDPAKAVALPEMGFVLSRLRVFKEPRASESVDAEGAASTREELFLVEVLADEADGFFRPIDTLRENSEGWGPYTRMRRPRWAAFLLDQPVEFAEGDRLCLELKHDKATDGQGPLVMQRLRVSTTDLPRFVELASDAKLRALREREEALMKAIRKIDSTSVPVLVEQPDSLRRDSYVLDRGNWLAPADKVEGGVPSALAGEASDRLALGRWFGSDENPLTARVMVNRVWAELFGAGLVETLDDFGSTGVAPTHPELLDDLAARFGDEMEWSVKRLLREIALSATYRQDARVTAELAERDPGNRLLARGPRQRLSAEMVRDQALVLSGRLNPRLGGPPVMPYQPEDVWRTVFNGQKWETATGPDRYRRAVYTYWKRTAAYPSMAAFDAPSREQCTARRPNTNTPLQALVTLNDPAFVELAEGLADRILARAEGSPAERIAWAAREATGHDLSEAGVAELLKLYEETKAHNDDRFAMTIVANVVLNLDASLTK